MLYLFISQIIAFCVTFSSLYWLSAAFCAVFLTRHTKKFGLFNMCFQLQNFGNAVLVCTDVANNKTRLGL